MESTFPSFSYNSVTDITPTTKETLLHGGFQHTPGDALSTHP
jgi:hypothetical protein